MTDPTPLYRNLVLERAQSEGCPAEVTKEALAEGARRMDATGRADRSAEEFTTAAVAYAYTAGRVARWDALVKGSPRLMDAILRQVHEFFHDEPFGAHDGTAGDCADCPTVAALAADAAAAYYSGQPLCPTDPDMQAEDEDPVDDEGDGDWADDRTTVLPLVLPDTITEPLRPLHTSEPDEWRAA